MAVEQSRTLVTSVPGPKSLELAARKAASVANGVGTIVPAYVVEASGGILVDADGNRLIDFGSGIAVTTVGNAAPAVVRRVTEAVQRFTHTCFMVNPYEGYVEVAERLAELTPGDHPKKSALFNSGAEAVENAIKIARVATGRTAVVCFDHAYHGRTNLTMAMTSKFALFKKGFGPFAPEVYRLPFPNTYRRPVEMSEDAWVDWHIAQLEHGFTLAPHAGGFEVLVHGTHAEFDSQEQHTQHDHQKRGHDDPSFSSAWASPRTRRTWSNSSTSSKGFARKSVAPDCAPSAALSSVA